MNLSNTAVVAGAGVALISGYRLVTAQGPEAQSQRRTALLGMAVGIAVLAVGLATNAGKICPIANLNEALQNDKTSPIMTRSLQALNNTLGISCENYLGWKSEFSKGIKLEDMHKPVMWGFTEEGSPFMAIKTACEQIETITRDTGNGTDITLLLKDARPSATQAFYGPPCFPNLGKVISDFIGFNKTNDISDTLTALFTKQTYTGATWNKAYITKLILSDS